MAYLHLAGGRLTTLLGATLAPCSTHVLDSMRVVMVSVQSERTVMANRTDRPVVLISGTPSRFPCRLSWKTSRFPCLEMGGPWFFQNGMETRKGVMETRTPFLPWSLSTQPIICYGTISRAPKTQVSYNITLLSVVPWCPPTGLSVGPRCTAVYSVGEEAITLGIMCTHTLRPGNQRESMRITTGIMELCAHLNL